MPTDDPIALLFNSIADALVIMHKETQEQRAILTEVAKRLGQLKVSVDNINKGV